MNMLQPILVAYASKSGVTVEVAQAVGYALNQRGQLVDVKPVNDVMRLDGYRGIVLGSAIRDGHWLPEAMAFLHRFHPELYVIPTAIFTVHLFNLDDSPISKSNRSGYTQPVHALIRPVAEAFFAGKLEKARLGFLDKVQVTVMEEPDQDRIDWGAIRAWSTQVGTLVTR
jgi:menaquinone-dependent protoporphyrinogen oxidase